MSNFAALFEFRDRWRHLADPELREIQRFVLSCKVSFRAGSISVEDNSLVTINCFAGPSDGQVSVADTEILNSNYIHLDFSPNYQEYSFEESTGALRILGKSIKVGAYNVTLQPIE